MSATDGYIGQNPDNSGKKLRTREAAVGSNTVEMPVGNIGDPNTPGNLMKVNADGSINISGSAAPHNLLDGVIDQDTVATTVLQGMMIYGTAAPKWAGLAIGANNKVLVAVAGLPSWGGAAEYDFDANVNLLENQALQFRVENWSTLPSPGNPGRLGFLTSNATLYYDNGTALVAI
jgi:hypothetical protein